ncbi:MAG: hypothetical protein ACE5H7_01235 [Acidiferrobacterales bacterium]
MAVGEPEKDNSPVDCCPRERPSQHGLGPYASDAGTAKRRRQGARENARSRSVYYVKHTTKRNAVDAGTTAGMEAVEARREQRPRYAMAADSW